MDALASIPRPKNMNLDCQEPPVSSDEDAFTAGDREAWAGKYLAFESYNLKSHSDLIQDLESDEVDSLLIETETKRLIPTKVVTGGFCAECRHLLNHWPCLPTTGLVTAPGRPFGSISEVEAAARLGCKFCALIFSRLLQSGLLDIFRKIEKRLVRFGHDGGTMMSIRYWPDDYGRTSNQKVYMSFPGKQNSNFTYLDCENAWLCADVVSPSASISQEAATVFELARMWLHQCVDSHGTCRNVRDYERPARLLSFDEAVAKLVLTENLSNMPQYATLSYCWGHEPFIMLTTETMNSFEEGIAINDLPMVFRDAICFARELGLSYIWIDALCIIQRGDNYKDWLTESGHMRSVYGNSFVNLAASSATNVHESLFSRTDPSRGGFYARVTTSEYCTVRKFYGACLHKEATTKTHLATRAWTLQERLLPARTIFIGNRGIFWECRAMTRCEAFPDESSGLGNDHIVRVEDQEWYWGDIVSQYSQTNLTNPSDRLPALAGIARRQHEATGDHYLAGMWKQRLTFQLVWSVRHRRRERPAWRAPSWSWMSVEGPVDYWSGYDPEAAIQGIREYVSVLDAWTTASGPDAFGQVSGGLLSIKCSALVRAELLDSERSQELLGVPRSTRLRLVRLDNSEPYFPVSLDTLEDKWDCNEVYLMPVFGGPSGSMRTWEQPVSTGLEDIDEKQLIFIGLVLRSCGEDIDSESRFVRVGSFEFQNFSIDMDEDHHPERDYYEAFSERLNDAETGSSGKTLSPHSSENWMNITIE